MVLAEGERVTFNCPDPHFSWQMILPRKMPLINLHLYKHWTEIIGPRPY